MAKPKKKTVAKKSTAVQRVPRTDPADMNPNQLVALAVQQNADIDKLEKLMDLQERFNKAEALKAFNFAMADFKKETIEITKDATVSYPTTKGKTTYDHATLNHIAKSIDGPLSDVGIIYRWNTNQEGNSVTVTCILTHDLGHSESTTLTAEADSSGGKNSIQAIGSTVTYLQRYTLIAACGLTIGGMDNDGHEPKDTITEVLAGNLEQLIKDCGANQKRFDEWLFSTFDVKQYSDLSQEEFNTAVSKLKAKKNKGR